MSKFRVALLGIIGLAVLTLAVWLYLQNWSPPPPVRPCKWDPTLFPPSDNTCYKRCGPPYTPEDSPVQAAISGKTYLFCCPKGYTAKFANNDVTCVKN